MCVCVCVSHPLSFSPALIFYWNASILPYCFSHEGIYTAYAFWQFVKSNTEGTCLKWQKLLHNQHIQHFGIIEANIIMILVVPIGVLIAFT